MGPGMEIQTFDRLTLLGRRWFFRIVDTGNNKILAQSESYTRQYARSVTAARLANALDCPLTETKR